MKVRANLRKPVRICFGATAPKAFGTKSKSGAVRTHVQSRSLNISQKHVPFLRTEMQLPPLFSMACISMYASTPHGCAFGAALAGRKSNPCNVVWDRFHWPRHKRKGILSEWTTFEVIMLLNRLACQAVVFEVGRNLAKAKSAYALLRRDSLRFSCLKAKAGGEGS